MFCVELTNHRGNVGLPLEEERFAPNGRPFKIGGDGDPIKALLA